MDGVVEEDLEKDPNLDTPYVVCYFRDFIGIYVCALKVEMIVIVVMGDDGYFLVSMFVYFCLARWGFFSLAALVLAAKQCRCV